MVNKVILIGNLGKDPELRQAGSSTVASLRVATSRTWFNKQTQQRQEETEWHEVEVWGKQAEMCGEYLAKGRSVYVEGRLKTDTWEKDGQKRSKVKVVADSVRFLGGGEKGGGRGRGAPADGGEAAPEGFEPVGQPAGGNDDIPF